MARQTATGDFFGCIALLLSADNNGSNETSLSYSVSRLAFTTSGTSFPFVAGHLRHRRTPPLLHHPG